MKLYHRYSWLLGREIRKKEYYRDIITPLKKGKKWLYELTLKHQPKTAEILLNAPMAIMELRDRFYLIQQIKNQYIRIFRESKGYNLSDKEFKIRPNRYPKLKNLIEEDSRFAVLKYSTAREYSVPKEIREAYYTRFNGFKMIDINSPASIYPCRYPAYTSEWNSIDGYLETVGKKEEYLTWIEEHFPGKFTRHANMLASDNSYIGLMVFLDSRCHRRLSRPDESHFVLLVKTEIQDHIIYVIENGDVKNMRILSEYKEAIDDYCSWALQDKQEPFDIMQYTSDFIDPRTQHDKEVYEITQEEIDWWRSR